LSGAAFVARAAPAKPAPRNIRRDIPRGLRVEHNGGDFNAKSV